MNTHDIDIELPPLPPLHIAPSVEPVDYPDVAKALMGYARAAIEPYAKRIAELESANAELERLCDETYVAQGADAYNLACEEMEDWQAERHKAGKEVGITGSLCDGIQWLYSYIEELEADRKRRGEPVAWPKTAAEIRDFIDVHYISMAGDDDPSDDDKYTLTAHDLLSAFRWWTGFAPQPAEPIVSDVEAIVRLLESREWAEHVATTPLGQRLETAVTALVGADQQPAEPVKKPWPVKMHAWGGATRYHDYEMSDGSIQTLRDTEAKALQQEGMAAEPVVADAPVPSDSSTHKWKRIEEYSKEFYGKKIDIYFGNFLLYCPELEDEENNGVVIGYYSEPYKGWCASETLEEVFPTHFMPLPEKPL